MANKMILVLFLAHVLIGTIGLLAEQVPNVAVVGGGLGGTSTAHYLRKLFGEDGVNIDLYEPNSIGGRLAVAEIDGKHYELGGSIIHPRNQYMNEFVKELGLQVRHSPEGRLGLYNGKEYIFKESRWGFLTYLKLFWRYGSSLLKWHSMIDDLMNNFEKIYSVQEQGYAFSSVDKLLAAMAPSFVNMTQVSARTYLKQQQFSETFINELLLAIIRVNYGQTADVSAFVGAVSLAGAEAGLWSVKGGNHRVPELLLERSKSQHISSPVREIELREGKFIVRYGDPIEDETAATIASPETTDEDKENDGSATNDTDNAAEENDDTTEADNTSSARMLEKVYDIVVVATPLVDQVSTAINFVGFPQPIGPFGGRYHRTVSTLVQGELNFTYLRMNDDRLDDVLTIDLDLPFNSLSTNYPVDVSIGDKSSANDATTVWKVFSQTRLSEQELDAMFVSRSATVVRDWLAYPHYVPTPEPLGPFVLHPGLYYTSSMEWAASAMEMSAVAARNAANLAFNGWRGTPGRLDRSSPGQRGNDDGGHSEL